MVCCVALPLSGLFSASGPSGGFRRCGSSMESWCVCVHLLFRRCLRIDVCLRPDRKHCGCSFASLAAAAWCAGAFVYIFCVEGVFVLGCVFLEPVVGSWIENLCCVALTQHSRLGGVVCPLIGAEQKDGGMAVAGVCSLSFAAGESEVVFPLVNSCVHDFEFHREDKPNTAGCLSEGTGNWASGRVDVPGSVDDEIYDMRQRPDALSAAVSNESSSTPDRIQAMLISLTGETLMIDAVPDAPVLLLVEDVAKLLGLPETCFFLTVGSRVLRDCMSLAAEGVGSDSVFRVCA